MGASGAKRLQAAAASLATAGLLTLAVSACSGSATGAGASSSGNTGKAAATGAANTSPTASPSPTQTFLTGSQLRRLLLPASAMPKGFTLDTSGVRNSGGSILPASSNPVRRSQVCNKFMDLSWVAVAGIGSATFAQNDYGNSGRTSQVAQEIDTFHGTGSREVMSKLWKAFGHCATFTYKYSGMTGKVTLTRSRLSGTGEQGIKAVVTTPIFQGGTTLVAIRVGNAVITCLYSSPASNDGSPVVKLAKRIAKNVQSAH